MSRSLPWGVRFRGEEDFEPFVLLEAGPNGPRVRKLTMPEKIAHSDRTGASVFMADEHEQEAFFGLLDRQADAE